MRYILGLSLLLFGLAACTPTQVNDGDQYFDNITPDPAALERKTQEERLLAVEDQPVNALPPGADPAQSGDTTTVEVTKNKPQKTKSTTEGNGKISDSQDFGAVKARETIASDAAKLEALKRNYQIVEPGAAPRRGAGINIAKYALAQTNPVGNRIYSRLPFSLTGKRRCANYISADEAQLDFLNSGGPQNDRRGVDPDGDGYACNWSPEVYRAMIGQ